MDNRLEAQVWSQTEKDNEKNNTLLLFICCGGGCQDSLF